MGQKLYDRVKETTLTTGTGTITLAGAAIGFRTFSSVLAVGDVADYCIELGGEWEVGTGALLSATTLSRDATAIRASSNAGNLVSFTGGTKSVFITVTADRVIDYGLSNALSSGIINL